MGSGGRSAAGAQRNARTGTGTVSGGESLQSALSLIAALRFAMLFFFFIFFLLVFVAVFYSFFSQLENYLNGRQKDVSEISKAVFMIRTQAASLVRVLCDHEQGQFVRDLLHCMGPYIELLYEALGKSSHKDATIFGRLVRSVCMEVALADMPYQFERLLRERASARGVQRDKRESRKNSRSNSHGSRVGSVMARLSILDGPHYSGAATPKPGARRAAGRLDPSAAVDEEKEAAEREEHFETARYESNKLVLLALLNPRDLKGQCSAMECAVGTSCGRMCAGLH